MMNEALANAIKERRWTHEKLASKSGLKRVTITNMINGKSCSLGAAYRVAGALGARVDDIFEPAYVLKLNDTK